MRKLIGGYYYIVQISSWSLVAFYQILITCIIYKDFWLGRGLFMTLCMGIAFGLTHLYRGIGLSCGLFRQRLAYQAQIAILASIAMSMLMGTFSYYGYILLFLQKKTIPYSANWLSNVLNFWITLATWLFLYHLYQYYQAVLQKSAEKWEIERKIQENEATLLQLQINPHFLFNTLNAIRALIILSPEKARYAVQLLDKLLTEGYLKVGFGIIPLEKELEIITRYMAIEQIRFAEKLHFELTLPTEKTEGAYIPAGTLLTLVENAVKHGFRHTQSVNEISLQIVFFSDSFEIKVTNIGFFSPAPLGEQKAQGIGLQNLEKRLSLYLDANFELSIQNLPDKKVEIRLVIHHFMQTDK